MTNTTITRTDFGREVSTLVREWSAAGAAQRADGRATRSHTPDRTTADAEAAITALLGDRTLVSRTGAPVTDREWAGSKFLVGFRASFAERLMAAYLSGYGGGGRG